VSGYNPDYLRQQIASGALTNAGRKHSPRIRRGDLKTKPQGGRGRPTRPRSANDDLVAHIENNHHHAEEEMKRPRTTWSVPRIRDPRFPGFQLRITELERDGPLYYVRQINGRPVFKKLRPEVTRKSLGADAKRKTIAIAMGIIEHLATSPDEVVPEPGAALTLDGLIKKFETDGLAGRPTNCWRN
jgi:hypothetical protein